ncbi:MAG: Threonylcarbamoyl-AMP synthase [Candidatus Izimaplasma bacterium HR2]|nr:MAG: Threonylcarbamoyl-AMP synthase [Candidatus Izimaplasma bacterium HR2]
MIIDVKDLLKINLKDEVIVFETDTVYGIGCLIDSENGIKKIYEIKKREDKKPLAVLCASNEQVKNLVKDFELNSHLADKYWPGALTLIFNKTSIISDSITSGFNTVGVRIPNDKIALEILEKYGPMAVTSLNISTEPAVLKFEETLAFLDSVDYIVKGKDLSSISSTVYDCVNNKVLRQGKIEIG